MAFLTPKQIRIFTIWVIFNLLMFNIPGPWHNWSTVFRIRKAEAITMPQAFYGTSTTSIAVGTAQTQIGAATTTLASGNNVIIAVAQFQSGANASIPAGGLAIKKGSTYLATTTFAVTLSSTAGKQSQYGWVLGFDSGAAANVSYQVTASTTVTPVNATAQILVLNGLPTSTLVSGASVALSTTPVLLASTTMPAAGDNVIIAVTQFNNTKTTATRTIVAGALNISRGSTVIATTTNSIVMEANASGNVFDDSGILINFDPSAAANTNYNVNASSSAATSNNAATELLVFNGIDANILNAPNSAVSNTATTTVANVTTTFALGNNVVIGDAEIKNNTASTITIATSSLALQYSGVNKTSNFYLIDAAASGGADFRDAGLMWFNPNAPSSSSYVVAEKGTATSSANLLALSLATTTFTQSSYGFFQNINGTSVGVALAAQNTSTTLTSTGQAFRLRMLVGVGQNQLPLNAQSFNLQFAGMGTGTCTSPSGGNPATYTNVSSTSLIAFNTNSGATDGAALTASSSDPTDGTSTIVNETYNSSNSLITDSQARVPRYQDAKFDFSLIDNSAPSSTTYCFRLLQSSGTVLDSYSFYPQITTAAVNTISCSTNVSSTSFGTLTTTAISTSTPNASTTMSCTGAAGCTLSVNDLGGGATPKPGLWNSTSSYLIPSPDGAFDPTTTLVVGIQGYGIQATTTANGSGGTLNIPSRFIQVGNNVGGLTTTTLTLASSTASVTSREIVVTHAGTIQTETIGGNYNDTITYSCLGN